MIRVLGLGNVLMSDDGFGPFVIRVLEATYECPAGVEFVDVGTPGLDLTPFLLGAEAVIFVDTVTSHGVPGEIRLYDRQAILRVPPQTRTGGHDPALKEAPLSPRLEQAVGPAVLAVVDALRTLGIHLLRKEHPQVPHIWWAAAIPDSRFPIPDSRFAIRD
jgi:hydrogenase maturation protease